MINSAKKLQESPLYMSSARSWEEIVWIFHWKGMFGVMESALAVEAPILDTPIVAALLP